MHKKRDWINILIIAAIVFLIVGGIIFYFNYTRDCGGDEACFNEYFAKCDRSTVETINEGGLYSYTVKGTDLRDWSKCVIVAKMEDVLSDNSEEIELLEGKSMTCKIPKNQYKSIREVPQLVKYCSGPLKEGSYELIIRRMYGLVLKNMGSLIGEANKLMIK